MKTDSPHTGSSFLNHCHYRSFGGNAHFLYSSGVLEKYDYESGANDKPLYSLLWDTIVCHHFMILITKSSPAKNVCVYECVSYLLLTF